MPGAESTVSSRGLPSVMVPVLSTTRVVDLLQDFQRFGFSHQHAQLGARDPFRP